MRARQSSTRSTGESRPAEIKLERMWTGSPAGEDAVWFIRDLPEMTARLARFEAEPLAPSRQGSSAMDTPVANLSTADNLGALLDRWGPTLDRLEPCRDRSPVAAPHR